jgi:Ca2+-binding RTX toxin-like protein
MTLYTFTAGQDNFTGLANVVDNFEVLDPAHLTSTDVAAGGDGVDFMQFASGVYTQAQVAGISGMESYSFSGAGPASFVMTALMGATASGGQIGITGNVSMTIDASAIGPSSSLSFYTQSAASLLYDITLGAGDDSFQISNAAPAAASRFDGGAGFDRMAIILGALPALVINDHFTSIEQFLLLSGSSATISASFAHAVPVFVTLNDGACTITVEAGATVAISALCFAGTDTVNISSSVIRNDEIVFDPGNLAGTDHINGGGGTDDVLRFRSSGNITQAQLAGVSAVEHVIFDQPGNQIALNASMLTGVASSLIRVDGGAGADVIDATAFGAGQMLQAFGGLGTDTLRGGGGNDQLDGQGGADAMTGGNGNDIYYVDDALDLVTELNGAAGGTDSIFAAVSLQLTAGVERLYLTGAANINATGLAAQNDILVGNSGNNILNGLNGADFMRGGLGNDTYYVDSTLDTTDEVTGGGGAGDYVYSTVSFTAAAGIERLYLTGAAVINGTGRDGQNDIIIGNSAANVLSGLTGNDVLIGGLGNDTLNGGAGLDTIRFDTALNAATNMDTVTGFAAIDDVIQLENAVFTALAITGVLAAGAFNTGAAATQADDRIIYNSATGALLYDADGLGVAAGIQFAALTGAPVISAADFVVI